MIKMENVSAAVVTKLGEEIGRAFMAEEGCLAENFTLDEGIQYFRTLTELYYETGCLYTTSVNYEGFAAYWRKQNRPRITFMLKMIYRLLKRLPFSTLIRLIKSLKGWKDYEEKYKKERDYVSVSMVVVLKEYQGKGFMRKVLEDPFVLAESRNIPCILDTDSTLKAEKYIRYGMKVVSQKQMTGKNIMYTMEYRS